MKILFLAPYLGLKELAITLSEEYSNLQIDVTEGNYEKGPKFLLELGNSNAYDAIITRGGTVESCKKVTSTPIIEVYITAFDIIRVLKLAASYKGNKIFLAYPTLVKSFRQLSELLGYSIEAKAYYKHKDVYPIVSSLKAKGYDLIIGDSIVYTTSCKIGIDSILLTSGIEAVRSAIEEAIRLCTAMLKIQRHTHKLYSAPKDPLPLYSPLDKFITLIHSTDLSASSMNTIFPSSILKVAKELSYTSLPTVITGTEDMCTSDLAYLFFCFGPKRMQNIITIACSFIPENYNFTLLLSVINNFLAKGGTVFLEQLDKLSMEGQSELLQVLKVICNNSNIKVISSCEFPLELCIKNGMLLKTLGHFLDEVRINLLPLNNYASDLRNMIILYLSKLDIRCGSQVVGVSKGGIALFKAYNWPGNIKQFLRVMNTLTLTCTSSYISEENVKAILKKETDNYKSSTLVPINLSGSFKDIELRILKYVLRAEGMNQSKVERRLKISHSTLWRKLK